MTTSPAVCSRDITMYFDTTIERKIYQEIMTQSTFVCWKRMNAIVGFSHTALHAILFTQQSISWKIILTIVLFLEVRTPLPTKKKITRLVSHWFLSLKPVHKTNPHTLNEHRRSHISNYRCTATYGAYEHHTDGLSLQWCKRRRGTLSTLCDPQRWPRKDDFSLQNVQTVWNTYCINKCTKRSIWVTWLSKNSVVPCE